MNRRVWLPIGLLIIVAVTLWSSIVQVAPGEVVVVRRLGRLMPVPWRSGLHLGLPLGLETRDRVRVDEVRRLTLGLVEVAGPEDEPSAGEFLTGDQNFVRLRSVVHYRVSKPPDFVLKSTNTERILEDLALVCLSRSLASRSIDDILGPERVALSIATRDDLQHAASTLELGVSILEVNLTEIRPPREVETAFNEAQSARSHAARRHQEALAYKAASKPAAEAAAVAILDRAHANSSALQSRAGARAARFLKLLEIYRESPILAERSFYLDTLRDLLRQVGRKVVLAPDEPVDISLFEPR